MKTFRTLALTLFFFIGILVPSCDWITDPDDCNCQSVRYFDIEGLDLYGFIGARDIDLVRERDGDLVQEGDELRLEQFAGFYLDYLVEYHAQVAPQTDWSFSLMSSALACTCIPGGAGAKEDELAAFTITTLNDFDEDHLTGSALNDLFTYAGSYFEDDNRALPDFLIEEQTGMMMYEDMYLLLDRAPTLDSVLHVRMTLELATGEIYEAENLPFVLRPN